MIINALYNMDQERIKKIAKIHRKLNPLEVKVRHIAKAISEHKSRTMIVCVNGKCIPLSRDIQTKVLDVIGLDLIAQVEKLQDDADKIVNA